MKLNLLGHKLISNEINIKLFCVIAIKVSYPPETLQLLLLHFLPPFYTYMIHHYSFIFGASNFLTHKRVKKDYKICFICQQRCSHSKRVFSIA